MATYGELFAYLESEIACGENVCDNTLRYTKRFAEKHGLCFEELSRILNELLGRCDCMVLLNADEHIPDDDVIGKETFQTPVGIAIEKGFYCHSQVDGKPASFQDAQYAGYKGRSVKLHVPCGKDDPYARPDLNRAIASQME